ncbi:MAG TPA: amidohydrolase family protein [Chitinophagaceae bacterium]|nr:amidohydrolase family protein [Chitinophagaceae bacterium]
MNGYPGNTARFSNFFAGECIDSHQHFWKYDILRHSWINDDMQEIRKDFMPEDLYPILEDSGVNGTVLVQVDQNDAENEFQLTNAQKFDYIRGVVGWVDLQASNIEDRLVYYSQFEHMKGFRHILQGEADRALMLKPAFKHGISLLAKYNYTYDILIFPDQLQYALQLADEFPGQPFVIDHAAKPYIKAGKIDEWKKDMQLIARLPNVYCKISGMVTEADFKLWNKAALVPYLDAVVEAFGMKRIMFGSDWPVCLVATTYKHWVTLLREYFEPFSQAEKEAFFGANAAAFYHL